MTSRIQADWYDGQSYRLRLRVELRDLKSNFNEQSKLVQLYTKSVSGHLEYYC